MLFCDKDDKKKTCLKPHLSKCLQRLAADLNCTDDSLNRITAVYSFPPGSRVSSSPNLESQTDVFQDGVKMQVCGTPAWNKTSA